MRVLIEKLQGETGLIKPGSLVFVPNNIGTEWVKKGWAKEIKEIKEEKIELETKEEKFTKKVKQTKKK